MESCLIADDHALVRDALSLSIAARWPDAVIWEAADFPSAWTLAEHNPQLCLMDLGMAGSAPREGIARLRQLAPASRIVVVTGTADDALMLTLLDDGVEGFVPKSARASVIGAAIDLVMAGGRYLPERLGEMVALSRRDPALCERLSPRQMEALRLISQGLTNKEIARTLGLSPATIKVHIAQAMSALSAANRTDAAIKARDLGLI